MVNNTPIYSSWSSSFSFLKENMTFLVDLDILLIEAQNPCDSNHPGLYSRPYSCASILHGLLSRSYNELSRLSLCQVLLIIIHIVMLKNYTILINSPNCQFLHSNQFSKYIITFLSKFHMKFFIDSLTLNNFFTNLN